MSIIPPPGGKDQDPLSTNQSPQGDPKIDWREQLFNDGKIGPIMDVQLSTERIVQLNALMCDIDPGLIQRSSLTPSVPLDPREFYDTVAKKWLSRHPVLAKAEVRVSGTGLHVILRFSDPPTFTTDGERDRWTGIVQAVQASLPIDTHQPHITAVTRPVGSVNSRNSAVVELLTAGQPVSQVEVLALHNNMQQSPFTTVLQILAGDSQIKPCPICNKPGKQLSALDQIGRCYGSCGNVTLTQLYDVVLATDLPTNVEVSHDT